MATSTQFTHTYTCDMCGDVILENTPKDLHPDQGTTFRVEAPGVNQDDARLRWNARSVLVCNSCSDRYTIAEFAEWLESTK